MFGSILLCTSGQLKGHLTLRRADTEGQTGQMGSQSPKGLNGQLLLVRLVFFLAVSSFLLENANGDDEHPCICNSKFYRRCPPRKTCSEYDIERDNNIPSLFEKVANNLQLPSAVAPKLANELISTVVHVLMTQPSTVWVFKTPEYEKLIRIYSDSLQVPPTKIETFAYRLAGSLEYWTRDHAFINIFFEDLELSEHTLRGIQQRPGIPKGLPLRIAQILGPILYSHLADVNIDEKWHEMPLVSSKRYLREMAVLKKLYTPSLVDRTARLVAAVIMQQLKGKEGMKEYEIAKLTPRVWHDPEDPDHVPLDEFQHDLTLDGNHLPRAIALPSTHESRTIEATGLLGQKKQFVADNHPGTVVRHRKVYVMPRKEPIADVPIHPISIRIPVKAPEYKDTHLPAPKPLFEYKKYTTYESKPEIQMVPVTKTIIKPVGVSADQIINESGSAREAGLTI